MVSNDDVINEFIDSLSEEARKILEDLQKDAETFKEMGITFEEKAFYDILKAIKEKYEFEYAEDKLIELAKKVKAVVDDKLSQIPFSPKCRKQKNQEHPSDGLNRGTQDLTEHTVMTLRFLIRE